VLTLHDLSLFRHPESHPRTRLLSTRRLLPRLARRAAAVVAPSDFTRGEILDLLQLPAERVHTVPLAAAGHFQPVRDPAALGAVRDRYRLPPRFALFVGTLEPRKNLHRLVRAFHAVRARGLPHELILAGPSGWLMDGFARDVERLGLATVVRHIGYVPTADLAALYSLAELFVYPSLYEGFGLPALEAMACRTPVLTSDGSGLAEVCGDAAWRVDPLDQAALAEALYRLLDDRELREALARRGLARAGDFSWDRAARQTMTIYRQVAAHRR